MKKPDWLSSSARFNLLSQKTEHLWVSFNLIYGLFTQNRGWSCFRGASCKDLPTIIRSGGNCEHQKHSNRYCSSHVFSLGIFLQVFIWVILTIANDPFLAIIVLEEVLHPGRRPSGLVSVSNPPRRLTVAHIFPLCLTLTIKNAIKLSSE